MVLLDLEGWCPAGIESGTEVVLRQVLRSKSWIRHSSGTGEVAEPGSSPRADPHVLCLLAPAGRGPQPGTEAATVAGRADRAEREPTGAAGTSAVQVGGGALLGEPPKCTGQGPEPSRELEGKTEKEELLGRESCPLQTGRARARKLVGSGCRKTAQLWALELSPSGGRADGGVSMWRAAKEARLWATRQGGRALDRTSDVGSPWRETVPSPQFLGMGNPRDNRNMKG